MRDNDGSGLAKEQLRGKMKILLITPLFQPEPNYIKGMEFAHRLQQEGHSVQVLTVYPNYPGGKIYPGYRMSFFQKELLCGVEIIRVPFYPSHNNSSIMRFLTYISMAFSMVTIGLNLVKKPDVVHVYQGPATVLLPAIILKLTRGVPYVLDLQDIWPDSVSSSGMMNNRILIKAISYWSDLTYRLSSHIIVLSKGYQNLLVERGINRTKTTIVYNWCNEAQIDRVKVTACPELKTECFNIIYAGNVGQTQGMDILAQAARVLHSKNSQIRFVVIASGVAVDALVNMCKEYKLTNLKVLPRFKNFEDAIRLMKGADALFLHLKKDKHLGLGIPQKTQVYLALGRPILIGVEGEASKLVVEAGAGMTFIPENVASLVECAERMQQLRKSKLNDMGINGRVFYLQNMSFNIGMKAIMDVLSRALIESKTLKNKRTKEGEL